MPDLVTYGQALKAAEDLSEMSDQALYEQMGLRVQDTVQPGGEQRAQMFDANYAQEGQEMLSVAELREVGRRWADKLQQQFLQFLCAENNAEVEMITQGKTIPEIAAGLATAAIVTTFAPPSWVIVAATLIATKVVETGLDSLCEVYRESVAEAAEVAEAEAYRTAESDPEVIDRNEG